MSNQNNQNNQNPSDNQSSIIGVAWERTPKSGNGGKFLSIAFTGNREEDEFEVILRKKGTNQELPLFSAPVILVDNTNKKTEKHPDKFIKTFYK